MIEGAPKLMDHLGDETREHFLGLCKRLDAVGIAYKLNSRLVRGLDYYNRTVFEWVTTKLGSQGTIAGGGRYDSLVARLGGDVTSACGFGLGMERVFLLMQEYGLTAESNPDAYLVNVGELADASSAKIAETLRDAGLSVVVHAGGGSFKSQMKKADKSGARFALILGDDEVQANQIVVKPMLGAGEQVKVDLAQAITLLKKH